MARLYLTLDFISRIRLDVNNSTTFAHQQAYIKSVIATEMTTLFPGAIFSLFEVTRHTIRYTMQAPCRDPLASAEDIEAQVLERMKSVRIGGQHQIKLCYAWWYAASSVAHQP